MVSAFGGQDRGNAQPLIAIFKEVAQGIEFAATEVAGLAIGIGNGLSDDTHG